MSSAVVSTSALGRPFLFDSKAVPQVSLPTEPAEGTSHPRPAQRVRPNLSAELASTDPKLAHITPASRLEIRPAPEMVSSGVPAIDALTGGLPRGCLTEICGPASSGRTTLLLAALAAATRRGEFCVVVDASDALDPHFAAAAGVELDRLLWVRCSESSPQRERSPQRHPSTSLRAGSDTEKKSLKEQIQLRSKNQIEHRIEQVLRATDLLLESGGFGLIVLDLADLPIQSARRIPLTTWFRFRRAVENKPTILLAIEQHPIAGSCSSLLLQLESPRILPAQAEGLVAERRKNAAPGTSRGSAVENEQAPEGRKKICIGGHPQSANLTHVQLLTGLEITAELIISRLNRKPAHSVTFTTKTAWAG
jgi:recA bacterial DNA recombination protein